MGRVAGDLGFELFDVFESLFLAQGPPVPELKESVEKFMAAARAPEVEASDQEQGTTGQRKKVARRCGV